MNQRGGIDEAVSKLSSLGGLSGDGLDEIEAAVYEKLGVGMLRSYIHGMEQRRKSTVVRFTPVHPILRFTLQSKEKRLFSVSRARFSGGGGWLWLSTLPLPKAVNKYIPHLGKDSFFDLM